MQLTPEERQRISTFLFSKKLPSFTNVSIQQLFPFIQELSIENCPITPLFQKIKVTKRGNCMLKFVSYIPRQSNNISFNEFINGGNIDIFSKKLPFYNYQFPLKKVDFNNFNLSARYKFPIFRFILFLLDCRKSQELVIDTSSNFNSFINNNIDLLKKPLDEFDKCLEDDIKEMIALEKKVSRELTDFSVEKLTKLILEKEISIVRSKLEDVGKETGNMNTTDDAERLKEEFKIKHDELTKKYIQINSHFDRDKFEKLEKQLKMEEELNQKLNSKKLEMEKIQKNFNEVEEELEKNEQLLYEEADQFVFSLMNQLSSIGNTLDVPMEKYHKYLEEFQLAIDNKSRVKLNDFMNNLENWKVKVQEEIAYGRNQLGIKRQIRYADYKRKTKEFDDKLELTKKQNILSEEVETDLNIEEQELKVLKLQIRFVKAKIEIFKENYRKLEEYAHFLINTFNALNR
ncbi:hypothetical protein SNEBB_002321 [Seison nebaliae]|nr:hypothetical protein SNEBB_002321 [Seison nebaliae]